MLVICEDCARKYNIDESHIKGNRARFACKGCGHIIIVEKTDLARPLIQNRKQGATPSIDLLQEMEDSLASEGKTLQKK